MMQQMDLTGEWILVRTKTGDECPAEVPGDNVSALLAAGQIPDPYVGRNELAVQWIGKEDWLFKRCFSVSADLLQSERVLLEFESLDAIAEIRVNGRVAGTSTNMFTRCRLDVKELLQTGENELLVAFRSPEVVALERHESLPYPVPCSGAPVQSPHRNMLRKVQCHAGWDWGCCLMTSGLYGAVSLLATGPAVLEHVYTEQKHAGGDCRVWVTAEIDSIADCESTLQVTLGDQQVEHPVELHEGRNAVSAEVLVREPRLWWPNGAGDQHLYDLSVRVAGAVCRKRLGLRRIELISEDDDIGKSFSFEVNGVPLFCKGANWIPADAMPQRQTSAVYRDLLESAAAANMNMIRVWGGGQYERDAFYETCDELGLLVWQDFMFACSMYPSRKWFLDEVRAEAEYQIKRLRDHACIALWCGNNENFGALNWYAEPNQNRDRYVVDYDRLYEGVLGTAVDAFDPTRTYWPSSPSAGREDYTDCWHDDTRGDMHYWDVWHGGKPFAAYYDVVPRFCSEFGYQSFPSKTTVETYAGPAEMNVTSPVMEHHQRSGTGNSRIVEMFTRYFRMPEGFDNFLYLSQVQQALAIKTGVEYWRSLQPTCMGAIYWQLNDNWPVCSWASLEYGGKWKLLHYLAKRFFAPLLLAAYPKKDDTVDVCVINERRDAVEGTAVLRVMAFDGAVRDQQEITFSVDAGGVENLLRQPAAELHQGVPEEVFLHLQLNAADGVVQTNEMFFTEYKRCELLKPEPNVEVEADGDGFQVELTAAHPAFFVSLDAGSIAGVFSDNCFTLLPGQDRLLQFTPKDLVDADALRAALRVYDLRGIYS